MNHRIANNSLTTEARENKCRFGTIGILEMFHVRLTKLMNNQVLLNNGSRCSSEVSERK